jgi:hypothetical protein
LLAAGAAWQLWSGATAQTATQTDHTIVVVHVVRNGHPATGTVTIRDDAGHEASCEVNGDGECELSGLAAGRHVVEATGPDGTSSGVRPVMLPENGKVSLIVQLAPPNAG